MKRRYRRKYRFRRKYGRRRYRTKLKYRRSKPVLTDSDWRGIYSFERRCGVLRGMKFPRF